MTQLLQLLVIAGALVGLVIFGFIRDKREHSSKSESDQQQSIYFPEHQSDDVDRDHRGAAMSRL